MKIAFYCLLYGKEYLAWSIRSIQDAVDEIHVIYATGPSFGHGTTLICPDSEDELKVEADRFRRPGKPIFWHRGTFQNEGEHRERIYPIARDRGADQILVVDADEIWDPETAKEALEVTAGRPEGVTRVRMVHFWRSLHWVCQDQAMPSRILNVHGDRSKEWYLAPQRHPVFHCGYSQSDALIRFKQDIHGHKAEWRPEWYEHIWSKWTPKNQIDNSHPTCSRNREGVPYWTPKPTRFGDMTLPWVYVFERQVKDHPYFGMELIP